MTLAPGPHALRLDYFQGPGDVGLTLLVSTTTAAAAQPISPSALSHSAVRHTARIRAMANGLSHPAAHVSQMAFASACPEARQRNAILLPSPVTYERPRLQGLQHGRASRPCLAMKCQAECESLLIKHVCQCWSWK